MSNNKQTLRRRPDKADKQPKLHEALHDHLTYPYTLEYYSPWDSVPHEWMPWIEKEDFYFNEVDSWYFDDWFCNEVNLPGNNCWKEWLDIESISHYSG